MLGAAPGTHAYVPEGDVDFVVSVIEFGAGDIELLAITAAPRSDEESAVADAEWINATLPHTLTFGDRPRRTARR